MKTFLTLAGSVLLAATLAACSAGKSFDAGFNKGFAEGYSASLNLDFQNGELVAHASGQPNAYITAAGSLRIGDHSIAVTPQQRALLKDYYGELKAIADKGEAVSKAGAELGVHAIGDTISGIFSGKSKQAQQSIEAQANAIDATVQRLCSNLNQLRGTQQALAAQLPAFKPYATMTQKDIDDCRTHALNDDDNTQ